MATTSERLKEIISIRNVKQAEIVEHTGINKGALSCYISGKYLPKQDNIFKLAKFLEVNPAWLMGLDVPMESSITKSATVELSNQIKPLTDFIETHKFDEMKYLYEKYDKKEVERGLNFIKAFLNATPERQMIVLEILGANQSDS